MSKDFQQQVIDEYFKQNEKLDPFVFATPQVQQYINRVNQINAAQFIGSYLITNIVLAPLQTIVTSLQLSVQKHKNIYMTEQAKTKELAKLNTEMTVHEKRKFQLMIRAGGKTIPYTAPVYEGYRSTFEGLKSQGWQAFFKGLSFRTISSLACLLPFVTSSTLISTTDIQQGVGSQLLKLYLYCMAIDIVLNPVHMMENRFILQNRIPEFRAIRKPFKQAIRMAKQGQAMRGLGFQIINNTVGFFTRFPAYFSFIGNQPITPSLIALFVGGELIAYPFATAYKRLQCQTDRYAGMIPTRYSGLFHALRVIAYEQGARGLWRGFTLHGVQTIMRLELLQLINSLRKKNLQ